MVIQLACQGTRGSRFIERRRYELDDAETSEAVGQEEFRVLIQDGRVFEVSILIKGQMTEVAVCPKCGTVSDGVDGKEGGQWVRWYSSPPS
jgi:hypothetical protein